MSRNYPSAINPATSPGLSGPRHRRKLVIVGGGGCGKTSLFMVYVKKFFPTEYIPTVFDNYVHEIVLDKKIVDLALWDTAGQEDYDRLRPLSYPDTDVIVLCYAINDRASFEQITCKWNPEVEHFCEGVPKLLVGMKSDLRTDPNDPKYISMDEGQELAYKIGACKFLECSAKTRENVETVFEVATRAIWEREKKVAKARRKDALRNVVKRCSIM